LRGISGNINYKKMKNEETTKKTLSRRELIVNAGILATGFTIGLGPFILGCGNPSQRDAKARRIMIGYVWRLKSSPGGNIGDYSITPGMVTLLNDNFPEYRITAIHQDSVDRSSDQIVHNNLYGFPNCDVVGNAIGDAYATELKRFEENNNGKL